MENDNKNREIEEIAADWWVRGDRGPLSAAEQIAFDEWFRASPLHRGAYARVEAVFALAENADVALGNTLPFRPPVTALAATPRLARVSRRSVFWLAGAAAAIVAAVEIGAPAPLNFETYETARGEVRAVPLEDGSVITLNTASKATVRFNGSVREVQLLEGEALFDVAKDSKRPFTVSAGSTIVRAVGTSFLVRHLTDEPLEVLVREGAVDMYRAAQENEQSLRVVANSRAVALDVPAPVVKLVNVGIDPAAIDRQLAWRSGMISFEDENLKSAAMKFARYSSRPIVIDDPEVAKRTVTGLYSIYDPEGFARSVALSLNLQVSVTPDGVMLWR